MSYLSRDSLKALAEAKLRDAELLLQHERYSNAYYLAGYAVELAFKAEISRLFMQDCLPDLSLVRQAYTHDLKTLLGLAGLKTLMEEAARNDPQLDANWSVASQWSEASRYEMVDAFRAVEMVNAVGHADYGLLTWLKRRW